jgi:hypothetical protein
MREEWRLVLQAQDRAVLVLVGLVAAFTLNWYVLPRFRSALMWIAVAAALAIIAVQIK